MTEPHDPGPSADPAPRPHRPREAFEHGRQLRQLRGELDDLREQLGQVTSRQRTDRDNFAETTGYVAELLPRVQDLEDRYDALLTRLQAPDDGDNTGANTDSPIATPATRSSWPTSWSTPAVGSPSHCATAATPSSRISS